MATTAPVKTGSDRKLTQNLSKAFGGTGGLSKEQQAAVANLKSEFAPHPPASRGNDFAPNFEKELGNRGLTPEEAFKQGDTTSTLDYFAGQASAPTAFSNANILDNKITQLDSQAYGLPNYGQTQFDLPEEGAGFGGYDISGALGLDSSKKKKGMQDTGTGAYNESSDLDPYSQEMMNLIKQMQQSSDRATQDQVSSISDRFDQLRQQQETSGSQQLAQVKQVLNLGGSSRYAPISSAGIVGSQVAQNTRALSDLDSQERQLVAQARAAHQAEDYQLLDKKLGILDTVRKQKADAASALDQSLKEATVQAGKDNAIAGLVSQGVTDPAEMIKSLNFDKNGNQIGDYTLQEVSTALGYLKPKGSPGGSFSFDTKQVGPLLGAGFSMQDVQQMQDDFNQGMSVTDILDGVPPEMKSQVMNALGVDPSKSQNIQPGVGATDALGEQMIRTRLFPKAAAILNKGNLSDTDRSIIDQRIGYFRDNGLSEQQILDVFSGWPSDVSTPFNGSFRDIILATQPNGEGVSNNLTLVGTLLGSGNYKAAMNKVENTALDSVKGQDGYMGKITTENYTKKIDRIKQILKQGDIWDGQGPVEGTFQNLLGRFKGEDATRLKAELSALYVDFRRENAGTAVTDSELKFLDPLFADITDKNGNFVQKLDAFQRSIVDRYNATRNTVSLPQVQVKDILDPNERLRLYAAPVTSDKATTIDI